MRWLRRRVKEVEEEVTEHKVSHEADKAADEVAKRVFQRYSENMERRLLLLEAKLEVARRRKRED